MKLLFCDRCGDIFNLDFHLKSCSCGHVKGKYDNNDAARVNGNGRSLAIGNGSFMNALGGIPQFDYTYNHRTTGQKKSPVTFLAWVRPHSGEDNPNTTVDKDL